MIEHKESLHIFREFFKEQNEKGTFQKFDSFLTSDFDKIVHDFNDFIVKKNINAPNYLMGFNFHDFILLLIEEVFAIKFDSLKFHYETLKICANKAKELSKVEKDIV